MAPLQEAGSVQPQEGDIGGSEPMGQENLDSPARPRIFSKYGIQLATFLGGLGGAAVTIGWNFYRVGRKREGVKWFLLLAVATNILIALIASIPQLEKIPAPAFFVVNLLVVTGVHDGFVAPKFREYNDGDFAVYGRGAVFGASLVGALATFVVLFCTFLPLYLLMGEGE